MSEVRSRSVMRRVAIQSGGCPHHDLPLVCGVCGGLEYVTLIGASGTPDKVQVEADLHDDYYHRYKPAHRQPDGSLVRCEVAR